MDLLKVQGLCKSFGGLRVIQNLDFSIRAGEIIGLIGPNGSGKTTILNLLTGFLKPDSGSITFNGKEVTGLSSHQMSKMGVGRTFQLVKPFLEFTALQNVMVGRVYGKNPVRSMRNAARESMELLEKVGLGAKATVFAHDLTLMQRKRLELARALATKPQLLLLDELMAGLNHAEAEEAMQLILQIRESDITIMLVEHIVKAICGLSNRIIVLNMGSKIAEGSPSDIVNHPEVIKVYLGKSHA